jgi:hypothetical protein
MTSQKRAGRRAGCHPDRDDGTARAGLTFAGFAAREVSMTMLPAAGAGLDACGVGAAGVGGSRPVDREPLDGGGVCASA